MISKMKERIGKTEIVSFGEYKEFIDKIPESSKNEFTTCNFFFFFWI